MKKMFLLIPLLLCSGCSQFQNNKDLSFDFDYSAGELVTDAMEIDSVKHLIQNGPKDYKKVTLKSVVTNDNSDYDITKQDRTETYDFYLDSYIRYESKVIDDVHKNGVHYINEQVNNYTRFYSPDLKRSFSVYDGEKYDYSVSTCESLDNYYSSSINLYDEFIKYFESYFNLYKDSNGKYTLIKSTISENYEETDRNDDKMLYTGYFNQTFVEFDSYFAIKSIKSYSETKTNRNLLTGEWYDNNRVVSSTTTTVDVEYGEWQEIDINEQLKITNTFHDLIISSISVSAMYGYYDKATETFTPNNYKQYADLVIEKIDTHHASINGRITLKALSDLGTNIYISQINAFDLTLATSRIDFSSSEETIVEDTIHINCKSLGYDYIEKNEINYSSSMKEKLVYFKFDISENTLTGNIEMSNLIFY